MRWSPHSDKFSPHSDSEVAAGGSETFFPYLCVYYYFMFGYSKYNLGELSMYQSGFNSLYLKKTLNSESSTSQGLQLQAFGVIYTQFMLC